MTLFKRVLRFATSGGALLALGIILFATPAHAARTRIVMLGDSLTAGFGLRPGEALPERIEATLKSRGHDVVIENAGVSGDTTQGGLARLDWSVPEGTDGVILALGANDMLRGLDPQVTRDALSRIIERLKERGIEVLLVGMLASRSYGPAYVKAFDSAYSELARTHDLVFYPFILEGVALDPELNQGDGIHPNAKGVERIAEGMIPAVEKLIARIRGGA